jgi:hypothetical protein
MKKIVVVSDLQVPYHSPRAVAAVCDFIADWKPDMLLNVGDDTDSPEVGRWNKAMAGEYAGTLQKNLDMTHDVHGQFRQALGKNKPYHVQRSNHGDRVETYVRKYAPALASLSMLTIEKLLRYDELNITYHRRLFEFLPGWVLAHGDEGGLVQTPGGTAMGLVRRLGKSVICGHTHRMGMQHESRGFNGRTDILFGIEVGHLMDLSKASYLKTGAANWMSGFVTLQVDGRDVYPSLHTVKPNGDLVAYGRKYVA